MRFVRPLVTGDGIIEADPPSESESDSETNTPDTPVPHAPTEEHDQSDNVENILQKTNKETNNLTLTAGTNLHVLYYDSASLDVYSSRALSGSFAATRSESVLHDMSSSNSKTFHFSIRRRKHVEAVGIGAAFTCPRRS